MTYREGYSNWRYYTNKDSSTIYQIANANTMKECWLGVHTLDVEMAIDDLKELARLKAERE